jgi:hypothetical protein
MLKIAQHIVNPLRAQLECVRSFDTICIELLYSHDMVTVLPTACLASASLFAEPSSSVW